MSLIVERIGRELGRRFGLNGRYETAIRKVYHVFKPGQDGFYELPKSADLLSPLEAVERVAYELGLSPFPIDLIFAPADLIKKYQSLGAPGRYPHWTLERDYHRQKQLASLGISAAVEHVTNTNPARIYLTEGASPALQMLNFACALAEADFYKNNVAFVQTNRQMDQIFHLHAQRVYQYSEQYGLETVADFFDNAFAIRHLIDPFVQDKPSWQEYKNANRQRFEQANRIRKAPKSPYDDLWDVRSKRLEEAVKSPPLLPAAPFPQEEEADVLWFIATDSSKLEDWQRDILAMVRLEEQYLYPQRKTEMMRAGWQAYQARAIMHQLQNYSIEWIKAFAALTAPYPVGINSYLLGLTVWEDMARKHQGESRPDGVIERDYKGARIDPKRFKGRADYDPFLARATMPSDREFVDYYLTPCNIEDLGLRVEGELSESSEKDLFAVKAALIRFLENTNLPLIVIAVGGADYQGKGILHLKHISDGRDLNLDSAKKVLSTIHSFWGRPVHLDTIAKGSNLALDYP